MRPRFGGTGKWHPLSILIVEAISCALMRFLHQFGEKHVSCLPRGVRIATRRNSGRTSQRTAAADDRPLFQKAQRLPDRPRWSFLRPSHTTIRQKNIAHLPKKLPPPFRHPDRRIGRRSAGSWLDHNGEARIAGGKPKWCGAWERIDLRPGKQTGSARDDFLRGINSKDVIAPTARRARL